MSQNFKLTSEGTTPSQTKAPQIMTLPHFRQKQSSNQMASRSHDSVEVQDISSSQNRRNRLTHLQKNSVFHFKQQYGSENNEITSTRSKNHDISLNEESSDIKKTVVDNTSESPPLSLSLEGSVNHKLLVNVRNCVSAPTVMITSPSSNHSSPRDETPDNHTIYMVSNNTS
jgi:hypothetical protein